jgi:cytochrome P450
MSTRYSSSDVYHALEIFAPQTPQSLFAWYQENAPVYWSSELSCWLVFNYADIKQILTEQQKFSITPSASVDSSSHVLAGFPNVLLTRMHSKTIYNTTGEQQTNLRRILGPLFQSQSITKLFAENEVLMGNMISDVRCKDHFDVVEDLARPVATHFILSLLGISQRSRDFFCHYIRYLDDILSLHASPYSQELVEQALTRIRSHVETILINQEELDKESVIAVLRREILTTKSMTRIDAVGTIILLLTAGQETSTTAISVVINYLMQSPETLRFLIDNPDRTTVVTDEILRLYSPIQNIVRFCTCDTTIHNQLIREGDTVMLILASANRDSHVFDQPNIFSINRNQSACLVYGYGLHHCIGHHIGRLVTSFSVQQFLKDYREDRTHLMDCHWSASLMHRRIERLWIDSRESSSESAIASLKLLHPYLPISLVPHEAYKNLLFSAESVPELFANDGIGIECAMTGDPIVDLGFQLKPHGSWRSSIPWNSDDLSQDDGERLNAWELLKQHSIDWDYDKVDMAWLEFDASGYRPRIPAIFFRLCTGLSRLDQNACLSTLLGGNIAADAQALLQAMPINWNLAKVGMFLSRNLNAARLCIRSHEIAPHIKDFLSAHDWESPSLDQILSHLSLFPRVDLAFDVLPSMGQSIGFECSFPNGNINNGQDWKDCMNILIENGLAKSNHIKDLITYCGSSSLLSNIDDLPGTMRKRWLANPLKRVPVQSRSISHLKFTVLKSGLVKTKIYLTASFSWVEVL